MSIRVRKDGKLNVIDISGPIKFGEATEGLKREFKGLLDSGETLFVFNMLEVPWLDSAGIAEMVACHKRAFDKKGKIGVVLKGRSRDLFNFYMLHNVFDIFDDVDAAVAAISS